MMQWSLFVGWCYTWTYISLFMIIIHLLQNAVIYVPEVTHTVWIRLLIKMSSYDWWRHSMCLVAYHNCSWSRYSFAVDHTYVLQLRDVIGHITLEKCFNLKHCHFIEWHHWCHRPKQCSSFVIDFMGQDYWTRLLAKFIVIFYIWCCYSIVAYVHLRLRSQLQLSTA